MKAFIIEFSIGLVITDGEKLLFDNTNLGSKYVLSSIEMLQTSSLQCMEWKFKNSTLINEDQRESIAELLDAIKQLKSDGWEFD